TDIYVTNCTASLTTAKGAFYTGASKTGTIIGATTTPFTVHRRDDDAPPVGSPQRGHQHLHRRNPVPVIDHGPRRRRHRRRLRHGLPDQLMPRSPKLRERCVPDKESPWPGLPRPSTSSSRGRPAK